MSGIRVIAGRAKGRRLKLVPGGATRPITDRVKENLFNIIGERIVRASFLDLFAGTGGVGIEALSRGAGFVRFLDVNRRAIRTIHQNLELTGLGDNAQVMHRDALAVLKQAADRAFDYIYIAPPQYRGLWAQSMKALEAQPDWLEPEGWAIAQIDPNEEQDLVLLQLEAVDARRYGSTKLLFFQRSAGA